MFAVALQIDPVFHTGASKYAMTAARPLLKPEPEQQAAELIEANVGVRLSSEDTIEQFGVLGHFSFYYW
jgi:hypothetical protein